MKKLLLSLAALFMLALPSQVLACPNTDCPMGEECPYENCADCPDCKKGTAGKKGKAMRGNFFDSADTNKDGMLSKDEFLAAKKAGWHNKKACKFSEKK